ncbi:MAG: prepilin peptidase [Acidobacteriota bacterium]
MMDAARIAAIAIVLAGALTDIRSYRIPNSLTLAGAALGLMFQAWIGGLPGLGHGAAGWLVGVAMFLPLFLAGGMGAGDIKLLGAVGAWLGPMGAVWCALFSVMAGGILALIVGARHGYLGKAFANLWHLIAFWRPAGSTARPRLTLEHAPGPRLPYGVAIAVGTCAAVWLK